MAKKKIEEFSQCKFVLEGIGDSRVETIAYVDAVRWAKDYQLRP